LDKGPTEQELSEVASKLGFSELQKPAVDISFYGLNVTMKGGSRIA
jgi:hypothetical protein